MRAGEGSNALNSNSKSCIRLFIENLLRSEGQSLSVIARNNMKPDLFGAIISTDVDVYLPPMYKSVGHHRMILRQNPGINPIWSQLERIMAEIPHFHVFKRERSLCD